jgi:hypothetical protein
VSEQAETALESSNGLADLVSFLDTPEEESNDENETNTAEESTGEEADTEEEANSEQTDEEADDSQEPDAEEETASAKKITFKVKAEDGTEETVEATPEELASSYMRQKDYTKKTQALAARESEAVQLLASKHEEMRSQYLSQAELTRAAIVNMAGIKSEQEMAQLANSDPASWVAENQRQQSVINYLNQLDQQIKGEKKQAAQQQEQATQAQRAKMFEQSWAELSKDGIDKPKLQKIYVDVSKSYGFTDEELGSVLDHRMVKVMKDAVTYRALKDQKPEVIKKVAEAPKMPSRQNAPANERRDRELESRFKNGRAKLNDLAAFLR